MRAFVLMAVSVAACTAPEDPVDGAAARSGGRDGGDAPDTGPDAGDVPLPSRGPFIVLADETPFAIAGDGADIDAVAFDCGDAVGYATRAAGEVADGADPEAAVGAPETCDTPAACAVSLGLGGHLVVELEGAVDLQGCTVRVTEIADRANELYRVYACPGFAFEGDCVSLGTAGDGETFEDVVR